MEILEYHSNVWPGRSPYSEATSSVTDTNGANIPIVRTFQVSLAQSITIYASRVAAVPVHVEVDGTNSEPLLLESSKPISGAGLVIERSLLQSSEEGLASLKVYNVGGFTERMKRGTILGDAVETCVVDLLGECRMTAGNVKILTWNEYLTVRESCWR